MPPSLHTMTPAEQRLARLERWRQMGHDATARNCFWAKPEDVSDSECEACTKMRRRYPSLNRVMG